MKRWLILRVTIMPHGEIYSYLHRSIAAPGDGALDDLCIYDSDTVLNIDRIPQNYMAVIGAGLIGCEYAAILHFWH